MLKKFQMWGSKGVNVLSRQLSNLFRQIAVSSQSQLVEDVPANGPVPTRDVRISPYERKIMVRCVSCTKVHELSAACHVCGAPLCENSLHCRKTRMDDETGMTLIYCPSCYMGR
jgi:hypothetical protein